MSAEQIDARLRIFRLVEVLWTLIRAASKARLPKEMSETWCGTCGNTERIATEPGSYDGGRVECPDCRKEG